MRMTEAERIATEVVIGLMLVGLALLLVVRGSGWIWLFALLALVLVNGGWALMLARALRTAAGPWWYRIASQRGVQLAAAGAWYMLFLAVSGPHMANAFVLVLLFLLGVALIGLAQYVVFWAHKHRPASVAADPDDRDESADADAPDGRR